MSFFNLINIEPIISALALFVSLIAYITTIRNKTLEHARRLNTLEDDYKELNETKTLLHELNGKITVIIEMIDFSSKK